MNSRCQELIDEGFTVLTASAGLARHLAWRHAARQLAAGRRCWETPEILPLASWLERGWQRTGLDSSGPLLLLSAAQTRGLWDRIIADSGAVNDPLQAAAVAERALQTRETLYDWGCPECAVTDVQRDAVVFRDWSDTFAGLCRERHWIDPAAARLELTRAFARGPRQPALRIAVAGFDEPAPLINELVAGLRECGARAQLVEPGARLVDPRVIRCADPESEALAAAAWARAALEQDPAACIGIVVDDLVQRRAQLEHAFEQVLMPVAQLAVAPERRPFAIAPGRPLADQPMIAAAISILELLRGEVPLLDAAALMLSPFLGDAGTEVGPRSLIERRLRTAGETQVDVRELQRMATRPETGAPLLAARLADALARSDATPSVASPRQWAQWFGDWLSRLGWPGARTLSSAEFQCLDRWHSVLESLAGLELVERRLGRGSALAELKRLLAATQFQPESGDVGIRILGPDGSADAGFDALWVMGMDADRWPRRAEPDPFIPLPVQRALGMPGAAPEFELRRAATIVDHLRRAAPEVRFSWAARDEDRELRPSPLLRPWLAATVDAVRPGPRYRQQVQSAGRLVRFADGAVPPFPAGASAGGVALLRDQSACPFRGFARHRMRAYEGDEPDIGLDAAARGVLTHAVLQRLWTRLGSQAALLGQTPNDDERLAAQCVDEALQDQRGRRPCAPGTSFVELERRRLRALAMRWMAFERRRAPFEVLGCEMPLSCRAGSLTLRGRIDRVDRLADGRWLIIDYKTGKCSTGSFLGQRPDEPQLPLYALNAGAEVAAVAYAAAGAGEPALVGVSAETDLLPGVRSVQALRGAAAAADWQEMMQRWRNSVDSVAAEFSGGHCAVTPKSAQSCRQCDLHTLCRIHEAGAPDEDLAEDDDD
jgi:probable DNA repair protein